MTTSFFPSWTAEIMRVNSSFTCMHARDARTIADTLRVINTTQREYVPKVLPLHRQLARRATRRKDELLIRHALAARADGDGLPWRVDSGDLDARAQVHAVLALELRSGPPLELGRVCDERLAELRAVDGCVRLFGEDGDRAGVAVLQFIYA